MRVSPPSMEELRARVCDSAYSDYARKLHAELVSDAPYFRALPEGDQIILSRTVHMLDSLAGTVLSRLKNSKWSAEQLRFVAPPQDATKGREFKLWQRQREDQKCLDAAWSARVAIFGGEWIQAVSFALEAGEYSQGRFGIIARPILDAIMRKGSKAPREEISLRDSRIVERAREIHSKSPGFKDIEIARIIHNTPKPGDPPLGAVETIRKRLALHRKLVRQGLPDQS